MTATHKITEDAYQRLVFANRSWQLELHDGHVREKPGSTWEHGEVKMGLIHLFMLQLDRPDYQIFATLRVRWPPATIYVPDLMVVPTAYGREFRGRPDTLAIFADPLPLVVEIWTAIDDYDVDAKIPVYQQRGDLEIWRIHPYERTLTAWRRQSDGTYDATVFHGEDRVRPMALPDVEINLADLFDD